MQEVSDQLLERIARSFRALGNPVRLKILHVLQPGELSVGEILDEIGGSQANASKHLGVLKGVGLVSSRREGVNVYYRISDEEVFGLCDAVCDSLHEKASAEVRTIERGREQIVAVR